jgi:uncharacterized protein YPO0396
LSSLELFGREAGAAEQFRLARLQAYNWGTFSGLADLAVARRGFLVLGPSGSGKSSLLDAYTALLTPPKWLDFNVAAREAERVGRDRTLLSYVRGAWAQQTGTAGEYAVQYLRPGTTWSALAATFRNEAGSALTLVALYWISGGSNTTADVRRRWLVVPRELLLRELEFFPGSDFDVRRLARELPDAFVADQFSVYRERFCRLLGIESELALKLLHRTQSAKNLGDLNTFLRDFMLDVPETFARADALVAEFGELKAAHGAVVAARRQIEILKPTRDGFESLTTVQRRCNEVDELLAGVEPYREAVRAALLREAIVRTEGELAIARGELGGAEQALARERLALQELQARRAAAGGARLEDWRGQVHELETERERRTGRRDSLARDVRLLGLAAPASAGEFAGLVHEARRRLQDEAAERDRREEALDALKLRNAAVAKEFAEARAELSALERQPSSIPAYLLEVRDALARELGVGAERLPFAGELMQVRDDAAEWRGALNRALRGLALSILVEEPLYATFAAKVNQLHLGQRLVFLRIPAAGARGRTRPDGARDAVRGATLDAVVRKLDFADRPQAEWLKIEIALHHALRCVDTLAAFRDADQALTREGLVKRGPMRHEKDDRRRVDDRSAWVLGFDNRDKREWYADRVRTLGEQVGALQRQVNEARERDERTRGMLEACQRVANLAWADVDVAGVVGRIGELQARIDAELSQNLDLGRLDAEIGSVDVRVAAAQDARDECGSAVRTLEQRLDGYTRQAARIVAVEPTPFQETGLRARFDAGGPAELETLDRLANRVTKELGEERQQLAADSERLLAAVEAGFATFVREWPAESGGLDARLASAEDFFAKLTRLEVDALPDYEARFLQLLHEQGDQNLVLLRDQLDRERRAIAERLEIVNDSLRRVQFSPGTHLVIDSADRALEDVREFRRAMRAALEMVPGVSDAHAAERRFAALDALVTRLGSAEPADRRWRDLVLDVRWQVEFVGREFDDAGREVEVYRSGAGKSGGQRQKLAATCLAAALRYQLGGAEDALPRFGTVVLDEAFDKADEQFTTLAMRIFESFGFQMIVATPMKSVMTLEPFVGGACFVTIEDRRRSALLLIEFEADTGRLRLPEEAREERASAVP